MLRSQTRLILVSFIALLTLYLVTLNYFVDESQVVLSEAEREVREPESRVIAVSYDLEEVEVDDQASETSLAGVKRQSALDVGRGGSFPAPKFQLSDLLEDQGARTVLYVWCGRRWFEFEHYLSVKSAFDVVSADRVIFEYHVLPVLDYWLYNTWYKELKKAYPFFTPMQLEESSGACDKEDAVNRDYVLRRLASMSRGGVYVDSRTVFDRYPADLRKRGVVNGWSSDTGTGFLATKGGVTNARDLGKTLDEQAIDTDTVCSSDADFNSVGII